MVTLCDMYCIMAVQVLGIADLTCQDIINMHILPAFQARDAEQLSPAVLASYLAFIAHSGLLTSTRFDGTPDTPKGKELLGQLRQCAVICTSRGIVSLGHEPLPAVHFPAVLQNQSNYPVTVSLHTSTTVVTYQGKVSVSLALLLLLLGMTVTDTSCLHLYVI